MSVRANLQSMSCAESEAPEAEWGPLIPPDQWDVFVRGVKALEEGGVRFLLHGAMALATYTGHWRNTKDVDVVIHPTDEKRAVAAMLAAGFEDYHAQEAYDRSWIFRGFQDGHLFDVIWALPNHRVAIDDAWFQGGHQLCLRGRTFTSVPPEELIRVKLYVMQRERCDWVDVMNVMAGAVDRIDWRWLVRRMERDVALLQSALVLFNWMSPGRAQQLPTWLRARFALEDVATDDPDETERRRVALFDSRPWFALHQPTDRPLER